MQKVKCPKCKRILDGKATTKKNGNSYFYYYCNDCKISIKESVIENHLCNFIDKIIEYDSVVNQFFLPMIKNKFENPKEELQKQLNEQRIKFDRIKKAYINGTFTLDEYELGIIYVYTDDESLIKNKDDIFKYIPDKWEQNIVYTKNPKPIEIKVKPAMYEKGEQND